MDRPRSRHLARAAVVAGVLAVLGTSVTVAWAQTAPDAAPASSGACATWVQTHSDISPADGYRALAACGHLRP